MGYYTRYNIKVAAIDGSQEVRRCVHLLPPGAKYCPECGAQAGTATVRYFVPDELLRLNPPISSGITLQSIADLMRYESPSEEWKWGSWKVDMHTISRLFPQVLFTIDGEGEEAGDLWRAYVHNGMMQFEKAVITYGEFDTTKLQHLILNPSALPKKRTAH